MASKIAGKILEAAVESFASSGFHGCTTKAISDRADCTEGSLFRLFGSKEKLFEAALNKAFERGRMPNDELERVLENDKNFERALRKGMLEFYDRLSLKYVRLLTYASLDRPEIMQEFLKAPARGVSRTIAHFIEREVYRGNLRNDIQPMTAALHLVLSVWNLSFSSVILLPDHKAASKEAQRATVKNFVEIWYRGMVKPTQNSRH